MVIFPLFPKKEIYDVDKYFVFAVTPYSLIK